MSGAKARGFERPRGFDAGFSLDYASIEAIARNIRQALAPALKLHERFPMERVLNNIEDLKVKVGGKFVALGFAVSDDLFPEGQTQFKNGRVTITLRTDVYNALRSATPSKKRSRALITAAHELAHAFVHGALLLKFSSIPHQDAVLLGRSLKEHAISRDSEWHADAIAAAIVSPAAGIALLGRAPTSDQLRACFDLGFQCAEKRLEVYTQKLSTKRFRSRPAPKSISKRGG